MEEHCSVNSSQSNEAFTCEHNSVHVVEQFFTSSVDHQAILMARESRSELLPVAKCHCGALSVFITGGVFLWGGGLREVLRGVSPTPLEHIWIPH